MRKSLIAVFALFLIAASAAGQVWFKGTVDEAVAKAKALDAAGKGRRVR